MENDWSTWNHPPMGYCNQERQMFPSNHGLTINPQYSYAEQCMLGHHNFPENVTPSSNSIHFSTSHNHGNQLLPTYDRELLSRQQFMTQFQHPPPAAGNAPTSSAAADHEGACYAAASAKEMAPIPSGTQYFLPPRETSPPYAKAVGRKRSSNRERHSKIVTAQGLRDRRMRLSVDVAHDFFGLQDMLGFDKASKTVGWLLKKSKAAIKELTRNLIKPKGNSGSQSSIGAYAFSTSESEDMSGTDETNAVDVDQLEDLKQKSLVVLASTSSKGKRILQEYSPKATYCPVARDQQARAKAREKARQRTRDKMTKRVEKLPHEVSTQDHPTQWSTTPLSPLGSGEESGSHITNEKKSSMELGVEINEPNRLGLPMFDYHQYITNSQGMNTGNLVSIICSDMMNLFPENWDMDITRVRSTCCDVPNMHSFTVDQGGDDPLRESEEASPNL